MQLAAPRYERLPRLSRGCVRVAAIVTLLLTLTPGEAQAFVPDARTVIKKLATAQPARLDLRVRLEEVREKGPSRWSIQIVAARDGRLRVDRQSVAGADDVTLIRDRTRPGLPKARFPAWVRFLVGDNPRAVLNAMRVNRARTSLARLGTTILWVLGAGPRAQALPQVQLERVTGRLRRVVTSAGNVVTRVDLSGRQAKAGPGLRWPEWVVVTRGKQTVRFRVVTFQTGQAASVEEAFKRKKASPAPARP